ncbi:MAG: helix-turn-helix domain-containing protein [Tepidanaerobacteraceae bacterium]|jgi:carbohydrate diacid regulator|nr:helix-turn-helix domain-containing protein [Tepidanaerobacteraceae bacterium]
MQKALINILSSIKPSLHTPFALMDKYGRRVFGDEFKKNCRKAAVRLGGAEYHLAADLPSAQLKDFCLLLEKVANGMFEEKLIAYVLGKNVEIEDFPFPCGLMAIKNEAHFDFKPLVRKLFEEGFDAKLEDMLLLIIPAGNIDELKEAGRALYETLSEEFPTRILIGIGGIASCREGLALALEEAKKAMAFAWPLKTGVIFYPEMELERLLSFLPGKNLREFVGQIASKLKKLDGDALTTIRAVLDCNLNMAEAARKLYIHRNTLMYRLDKIHEQTGLDIRNFHDAVKMEIYLLLDRLNKSFGDGN